MRERLRLLRKSMKLSQDDFAKKLGVTGNYIWMLEKGEREINDKFIFLICSLLGVSEEWFKTGNGAMFCKSRTDEIADITALLMADNEPMKIRFIKAISQLDEKELEDLYNVMLRIIEE